ncbi:hypothetical protein M885DRAFT_253836 [Pelagophyceae sp. CCMP2097]|nr:hypothetical protein M885DRAFT_253836 [Pelagophyceae sp. CCMP2097]
MLSGCVSVAAAARSSSSSALLVPSTSKSASSFSGLSARPSQGSGGNRSWRHARPSSLRRKGRLARNGPQSKTQKRALDRRKAQSDARKAVEREEDAAGEGHAVRGALGPAEAASLRDDVSPWMRLMPERARGRVPGAIVWRLRTVATRMIVTSAPAWKAVMNEKPDGRRFMIKGRNVFILKGAKEYRDAYQTAFARRAYFGRFTRRDARHVRAR